MYRMPDRSTRRLTPLARPAWLLLCVLLSGLSIQAAALAEEAGTPTPPLLSELAARLGIGSLGSDRDAALPPVEEAFRFQAAVGAPDRLALRWDIAPGTYLYAHLIELALEESPTVTLAPHERPPGELRHNAVLPDGSLGDVVIHRDRLDLALPLRRATPDPADIVLVARYQGCADLGICYPPQTARVRLRLPAAPATTARPDMRAAPDAPDRTASPPEQDRVADLLAHANLWVSLAAFLGFGLLLSLTPCVFPMIPILSGIIAGQGTRLTTRRAFTLSLVYVLAMALTYALIGVLAGLTGANLQAFFQHPAILVVFALVFVLLALAMFGLYELRLPAALQTRVAAFSNRQAGGTLAGVAVMGLLSALIVSPCVAPPLVGALLYIGQTGDALLGGLALFALGLGMGAPLLVIGASAGSLLPRAGAWMDAIKAVFGMTLLGVAILLLERLLPATVTLVFWGLLLICAAVYMGALSALPAAGGGWRRLWKGLGVALLIYGALLLIGAAAGGEDPLQPLRGLVVAGNGAENARVEFTPVRTQAELDQALAAARVAARPVFLDVSADWCAPCREMERLTFRDPDVIAGLARFTRLQVDVTVHDAADRALLRALGVPGPPALLFIAPDGGELRERRHFGFLPPAALLERLRGIGGI